jgi:PBSX family phage terminase large subunit
MARLEFKEFSPKQLTALTWWCKGSRYFSKTAIICDGAVRSGKTVCLALSFISWAFYCFEDTSFALCGKTVTSLKRNVIVPILPVLEELGFCCREYKSKNILEINRGSVKNRFYLFGGKDEGSASLIQGMTLGGVLFDEVALMPRSFVEQALARCSLEGSRFFFNCNPENPQHWFYEEWIKKRNEKNALYIHFLMEDNPSLTGEIIERYRSLYSGTFYERFVEGKWVAAEGLVYPFFSKEDNVGEPDGICGRYFVSCDYGTVNPASFGLWGEYAGKWFRLREYYHDSRRRGYQKTDEEYYADLCSLVGELNVEAVIVDPSAASFIECIRRHKRFNVIPAQNDVIDGIRKVGSLLKERKLMFSPSCSDTFREFALYRWDETHGRDRPRKENDHAMDDIRYFVSTVCNGQESGFFALTVGR